MPYVSLRWLPRVYFPLEFRINIKSRNLSSIFSLSEKEEKRNVWLLEEMVFTVLASPCCIKASFPPSFS